MMNSEYNVTENNRLSPPSMYTTVPQEDLHVHPKLAKMLEDGSLRTKITPEQHGFLFQGQYMLLAYYSASFDKDELIKYICSHQIKAQKLEESIVVGHTTLNGIAVTYVYINWGARKRFTGKDTLMFMGCRPRVYAIHGSKYQAELVTMIRDFDREAQVQIGKKLGGQTTHIHYIRKYKNDNITAGLSTADNLIENAFGVLTHPTSRAQLAFTHEDKVAIAKGYILEPRNEFPELELPEPEEPEVKPVIIPKPAPKPELPIDELFKDMTRLSPELEELIRGLRHLTRQQKQVVHRRISIYVYRRRRTPLNYLRQDYADTLIEYLISMRAKKLFNQPAFDSMLKDTTYTPPAPLVVDEFNGFYVDITGTKFHSSQVKPLMMSVELWHSDHKELKSDGVVFTVGQLRGMQKFTFVEKTAVSSEGMYIDADGNSFPGTQIAPLLEALARYPSTWKVEDDEEFLDEDCNVFTAGQLRTMKQTILETPVLDRPTFYVDTDGNRFPSTQVEPLMFTLKHHEAQFTVEDDEEFLDEDCNIFTAGQLRGMQSFNPLETCDEIYIDTQENRFPGEQIEPLLNRLDNNGYKIEDDEEFLDEDCNVFTAGQLRDMKKVSISSCVEAIQLFTMNVTSKDVIPVGIPRLHPRQSCVIRVKCVG